VDEAYELFLWLTEIVASSERTMVNVLVEGELGARRGADDYDEAFGRV